MIYADYAATAPLHTDVLREMEPFLSGAFYNPSSLYPEAKAVRGAVEQARQSVADLLHVTPERIVFTSGGTESDNLALIGTALHPDNRKRHLITSATEHHAVLSTCHWLETVGFRVTYLSVDSMGRVNSDALRDAIEPDTFLVSIMWVNNETGAIQPIETLARIAHEGGALFHTDAVQAMTTQDIDLSSSGVDLLTLSGHKIYGPKGAGALYAREGVALGAILHGGQQEGFLRGGTENTPAIVGLGAAARLLQARRPALIEDMERWKAQLLRRFEPMEGVLVNSPMVGSAPSILNLAFRDVEAEGLVFLLSREGVQLSMGAACNTKSVEPSHVIQALGLPQEYLRGCVRLSFGHMLDDIQVERLGLLLEDTVKRMRNS